MQHSPGYEGALMIVWSHSQVKARRFDSRPHAVAGQARHAIELRSGVRRGHDVALHVHTRVYAARYALDRSRRNSRGDGPLRLPESLKLTARCDVAEVAEGSAEVE
jgi:hypothetical protein